jgi:hypothetical protein
MKNVKGTVSGKKVRAALRDIRKQDAAMKGIRYYAVDNTWRKLLYVRYADDFLLGYIGNKFEAYQILSEIANLIDCLTSMELNVDKTQVKHHEKGVRFLGYKI